MSRKRSIPTSEVVLSVAVSRIADIMGNIRSENSMLEDFSPDYGFSYEWYVDKTADGRFSAIIYPEGWEKGNKIHVDLIQFGNHKFRNYGISRIIIFHGNEKLFVFIPFNDNFTSDSISIHVKSSDKIILNLLTNSLKKLGWYRSHQLTDEF